MGRSRHPRRFLTPEESERVKEAVREAESRTSAQIKVVISRFAWRGVRHKAEEVFKRLGLDRTTHRNAVLLLLVTTSRHFLIYGDQGIHEKVGEAFWTGQRDAMAEAFKSGRFADGLVEAVRSVGGPLAEHFPRTEDDRNEVPDDVVEEN